MGYKYSKPRSTNAKEAIQGTASTTKLPDIIGGPPSTGSGLIYTNNLMMNSSLTLTIQPCIPKASSDAGISLFRLEPAWGDYKTLLEQVEFKPSDEQESKQKIIVIAQADNLPTDTFTNEYGDHFLSQMADVAGAAFGQVAQMTGSTKGTQALSEALGGLQGAMGEMKGGIAGTIGGVAGMAKDFSDSLGTGIENYANKNKGTMSGTIASGVNKLLAGSRIDFPKIWKGHSYEQTFSCTIRLYNPKPGSEETTKKFIIGPLAALLTLAMPRVTDPSDKGMITYDFPFFHRIDCPGLFVMPSGAISSITVTKGGDHAGVAFNQRLSIIDVRIDFVNLFSSMILSKDGEDERPTLKGYLANLIDSTPQENIYSTDPAEQGRGVEAGTENATIVNENTTGTTATSRVSSSNQTKAEEASQNNQMIGA
jgi:hypothetical protein